MRKGIDKGDSENEFHGSKQDHGGKDKSINEEHRCIHPISQGKFTQDMPYGRCSDCEEEEDVDNRRSSRGTSHMLGEGGEG